MKNILFPTLLLTAALALTACNKDDDTKPSSETQRPTIALVNGTTTTATVAAGAPLTLHVRYADNVGLSQAKIEIHNDFDGHAHGKTDVTVDTLSYEQILNLNGKTDSTHTFTIPTQATNQPGMYHIILTALDVNGNEAMFVEIDLELTNGNFPQATGIVLKNGTTPISGDHYHLDFATGVNSETRTLSATIAAQGTATLSEIHVVLREAGDHLHKTDGEEIELLHLHDLTTASHTLTDQVLTFLRASLEHDAEYELLIEATDSEGRTSTTEVIELHVMLQ